MSEPTLCPCGHVLDMCHVENAERWCGANVRWLRELARGLTDELQDRRVCLLGARDDLARLAKAEVQDGGLWIRAVAEARLLLVEAAIAETDKALVAAGVSSPAGSAT